MSKFRKILIALLSVCMTVCAGVALAACDDDPDFINPDGTEGGTFSGKYTLTVQSRGGLSLNNVKVTVMKGNEVKHEGTSVDGKIDFTLTPDEYELVVDETSLPAGYYYSPAETVKTSSENGEVSIIADSKVITSQMPAGTKYNKGDVMYDFTFSDATYGTEYSLSESLKTKKAVMLNFWGTTCNPCVAEFPAIQAAYEAYQDKIDIFALSSYNNDSKQDVIDFRARYNISFPMALDNINLSSPFRMGESVNGVSRGWPTTVIIDRYGVVAYISSGTMPSESAWKALFNKYTRAAYSQDIDITEGSGGNEIIFTDRPENIEMPDAAAIAQALAGDNTYIGNCNLAVEDEKAWPWSVKDGALSVSNYAASYSYAIVRFDMILNAYEGIKFRYNANTLSSSNVLYMIVDGSQLWEFSENSEGWQECKLQQNGETYYARSMRTVSITLMYMKANEVDEDTPVTVDDFTAYNVTSEIGIKDFAVSAVNGLELDENNSYNARVELDEEENLYYTYYTDENGQEHRVLLVADVTQLTAWTDMHYGKYYFNSSIDDEEGSYSASLYLLAFYLMSNVRESDNEHIYTKIKFDPENIIFLTYTLQGFSDSGYVPVTPKLRDILIKFTKEAYEPEYDDVFNFTDEWYEDQWLELCYYFRHYGEPHESGEQCYENYNAVKGLSYEYAYGLDMGGEDRLTQEVHITKVINYYTNDDLREQGGGIKFKFTPEKSGVYLFTSTHTQSDVDPFIKVVDFTTGRMYENEDDERFDQVGRTSGNFYLYVQLEAGHEYGITATLSTTILSAQLSSINMKFDLHVEYVGEYAEMLRVATSGGGFWTWREDEDGNPVTDENGQVVFYYIASNVAVNPADNKYYLAQNHEYGERIYIDFVHYNYYGNFRPLKDLIYGYEYDTVATDTAPSEHVVVGGIFGANTDAMKAYYEQSVAGKEETDWNYGLLHADETLVKMLSDAIGERVDTNDWQQFACYKVTYGTKPANG